MNAPKHFFYNSDGEVQLSPSRMTCVVSEHPLTTSEELKKLEGAEPCAIGIAQKILIEGKRENIVLQGPFDLEDSEILSIEKYPVPTRYDEELSHEGSLSLSEILEDTDGKAVIRWNNMLIWFDVRFACLKEDFLAENSEEEKLYFYDVNGELQQSPNTDTIAISEKPLQNLVYKLKETAFEVSVTKPILKEELVVGSIHDLVLEEDIDLFRSEVLDLTTYPLPVDLENMDDFVVVRQNESLVWFDVDFSCFLKDVEKEPAGEEDEGPSKPFYKRFWFWIWLLVIGVMLYTYFVNN